LGNNIKAGVTGNPNVPNPSPTPAELGTMITNATNGLTDLNAAEAAYKAKLLACDGFIGVLKAGLTKEAASVLVATGGDPVKIESTNMPIRRPSNPIGPLGQVLDLALKEGANEGELKATWKKLRGAASYEVQVSVDPFTPTSWRGVAPSSKCRTVITGLTSGAKMWVRVRGIGKGNPGVWSDPATKIVP
jgi:hypothetical protein